MLFSRDIRPILYTARLFGCPFHAVTEDDIKVTRHGTIYTILCSIVFLVSAVSGIYIVAIHSQLELRLLVLTITRTVLSYMCLFTDFAYTLLWNWKMRAALAQLRTFDRATKFHETKNRNAIRNTCGLVIIVVLAFWSVVGYVTYRYEPTASVFNGVMYGVINAAISMQILAFVSISLLLRERFHQLRKMLLFPEATGKIVIVDRLSRQYRLQEVWWLHCCLANAAETINSIYAVQLLLWIASMSFNTLSRIYTINESAHVPVILKIRESLLVAACGSHLLLITAICHSIASQANRIGQIVFSPLSPAVNRRDSTQDNVEAAAYFQLRKVHFFAAAGLIRIDLPLLLSIASGITTYLVILHAANSTS